MRDPISYKIDVCSIDNATFYARERADHYIALAKRITEDTDRELRLAVAECPLCFKGQRVGGAMCTTSLCGICGYLMNWSSTCQDKLCQKCAIANGLCKRCAGDIDMKQRRKRRPFMDAVKK